MMMRFTISYCGEVISRHATWDDAAAALTRGGLLTAVFDDWPTRRTPMQWDSNLRILAWAEKD